MFAEILIFIVLFLIREFFFVNGGTNVFTSYAIKRASASIIIQLKQGSLKTYSMDFHEIVGATAGKADFFCICLKLELVDGQMMSFGMVQGSQQLKGRPVEFVEMNFAAF